MTFALVLFGIGMALSAFFSGSETGFYRLNRARLLIQALEGDRVSRGLLWAVYHPSLFVATTLVGNNVANYVTSAAIVMAAAAWLPHWPLAELIAPMLFAPVIFVYGELLPKQLFLAAPNRLLRRCAPALGVAAIVFAPVSAVLWVFSKLLETIGQKSPEELQMVLARRELSEMLDEGEAVGLLGPTQQSLAQATLALGAKPIGNFTAPLSQFPRITSRHTPAKVVQLAKRQRRSLFPVEQTNRGKRDITGYVRAADCLLALNDVLPIRSLLSINEKQTYLATITQMLAADQPIARVVDNKGKTVGFVTLVNLQDALLAD